ncbi:MAG: phage integrase SAM-like domain-containing protein, partial [candidate division Zixibacteria bacterium]|nr:phage integrase SAM-like domain-containing protein [candidate division Zixibacteria bacterium]
MGRIYKRKNVWYIDVHTRGRRIRKRVGRSKRVAELALQDAEVKIARDEFGFAKNDTAVDRFLEMFLEYSRANHQPSTTTRYGAVIDHLREFLQTRPNVTFLSEITPETIDQYKVFRKNAWVNPNGEPVGSDEDVKEHTRKGARAHTINFEVGVLRTIFNIAIKWKYLKENPARGIQKLKV